LGFLLFPFIVFIYRPRLIIIPGYPLALLPAIIGLVLGIIAVVRNRKPGGYKGVKAAKAGSIMALIIIIIQIALPFRMGLALRMVCGTNMSGLGKAINSYAQENNGKYPDPEKWCDLLLEAGQVKIRQFMCLPDFKIQYLKFKYSRPKPGKGISHYAMNTNCTPDSPADTVLLFETDLGWNKHGAKELLTLDNHDGDGCNILFNDWHVMFERRPKELNWGTNSNQPASGNAPD
jgi:prepilin-type processing-associated H-X9-DG protein